ncbi:MAG: ACP S-malonyltransferase [Pseudoclavibacter sp.]|nr:ACP S-malonyltransferase [Pseudoclavibacter sp.]
MIVVTCPGQGAQTPGMLDAWLSGGAERELIDRLSEAAGLDLARHGTVSDAETIRDTAVAQPLIVAAGILAWNALAADPARAERIGGVAGHSVGEITAAYAAGVFDAETAMRFVALRARLMALDAAERRSGMSAVLGGDPERVEARLAELGLFPANYNGPGQIVAAGEPEALERLAAEPAPGTRVVPLKVAGAFHTPFMSRAREALAEQAADFPVQDPVRTLWSNDAGRRIETGEEFRRLLVQQLARPVRWDRCMEAFAEAGASGLVELPPAGTLVGLAKRGLRGVPALALKSPEDLAPARELIDAAQAPAPEHRPEESKAE